MKEVSIGCSMGKCSCSICGKPMTFSWGIWGYQCDGEFDENGKRINRHVKGEKYDGKLCVGNLDDPKDAYEFSFVAVPAQRNAGVTKCCGKCDKHKTDCSNRLDEKATAAIETLMTANIRGQAENIKALLPILETELMAGSEREARAKILAENEDFRKTNLQEDTQNDAI